MSHDPARPVPMPAFGHGHALMRVLRGGVAGLALFSLGACAPDDIPKEVAGFVLPIPGADAEAADPAPRPADLAADPAAVGGDSTRRLLARAIAADPRPRERAALVDVAVAEVNAARGAFYPAFSLSAQASARAANGCTASANPALVLTARQMLADFGATDRAVATAAISAGLGHLDFLAAVDAVLEEALTQSAHLRYHAAAADLTRAHLARLDDIAALQRARDGAGFAAAPDGLDATRAIQGAAADLAETEADAARAARKLAQLTGSDTPLAASLTQNDCRATGTPLSVQSADLTRAAAEIGVTDADRARMPTLYLEGTAEQPVGHQSGSVGVNLRLDTSLFSGGFAARREAARANLAAATAATARAGIDAETAQADALADLANLARQAGAQAQELDTLAQMQDLYQDQYASLGSRSLGDLLDVAREYHQAELSVLATRRDMELALVDCVSAASGLRARLGLDAFALHGLTLRP